MRASLKGSVWFCLFYHTAKELCTCNRVMIFEIKLSWITQTIKITWPPSKQRTFSDGSWRGSGGRGDKGQFLSQPMPCCALLLTLSEFVCIQSVHPACAGGLGFHFLLFQAQDPTSYSVPLYLPPRVQLVSASPRSHVLLYALLWFTFFPSISSPSSSFEVTFKSLKLRLLWPLCVLIP